MMPTWPRAWGPPPASAVIRAPGAERDRLLAHLFRPAAADDPVGELTGWEDEGAWPVE